MKIKQNMISTKPVLHGFKVVRWILYAEVINFTSAVRYTCMFGFFQE